MSEIKTITIGESGNSLTIKDIEARRLIDELNDTLLNNILKRLEALEGSKPDDPILAEIVANEGTKLYTFDTTGVNTGCENTMAYSMDTTNAMNGTCLKLSKTATDKVSGKYYTNVIFDTTNGVNGFWMYISNTDIAKVSSIQFNIGTDWLYNVYINNQVQYILYPTTLKQGWNFYVIDGVFDEANTSYTSLYVRVELLNATDTIDLYLDSTICGYELNPTVMINFDNCKDSNLYSTIYPIMKQRELSATFAYQNGLLPTSSNTVTLNHMNDLINDGWGVAMYGSSVTDDITNVSAISTYYEELKSSGVEPLTYFAPLNNLSSEVLTTGLKDMGFKMARYSCANPYMYAIYKGNMFSTCVVFDSTTSLSDMKKVIDYIISKKCMISILFHEIVDTVSDNYQVSTNNFTQLLDYIKTLKDDGSLQVLTYNGLYDAVNK